MPRWTGRRARATDGRPGPSTKRVCTGGVFGIAAAGCWPALVRLLGATSNSETIGNRTGSDLTRPDAAVRAFIPYLHVVGLAVPLAAVGGLLLIRWRRAVGLGNEGWAWSELVAGAVLVIGTYSAGAGDVQLWLATSANRTTIFPALAAWWIVGTWAVVATAETLTPKGHDLGPRTGEALA